MNTKNGVLFVVSAPSGAGKTTLTEAVIKRLQPLCLLEQVKTYTTKELRENETDKYCLSVAEFQNKVQEGFFLEWSNAYGNYYGSPRSILDALKQGRSFIVTLDRAGAKRIAQLHADAVLVWIYPATVEVLRQRLSTRGRDTQAQIEYRLELAERELLEEKVNPFYNYHVRNDVFDEALKDFEAIIRKQLDL